MGFTFILLLAYLALTGLAVITFRSGRKALGGGVLAVMAVSTAVLGYLWVTSPMGRRGIMEIRQLTDAAEKQAVTRLILEALPEWFGIPEAREEYIRESVGRIFFCAYDRNRPVGFLCLKETGNATVELYVMGIRKEYHRRGIGRQLFRQARDAAAGAGYAFMQVKTVQMGKYEEYDRANRFYLALGFREFEVFPTLWDEGNPCQVYVMSLE